MLRHAHVHTPEVAQTARAPWHLIASPAALLALEAAGITCSDLLARAPANAAGARHAPLDGVRLLTAHTLPTGVGVWLITEADGSMVSLLLPGEYARSGGGADARA